MGEISGNDYVVSSDWGEPVEDIGKVSVDYGDAYGNTKKIGNYVEWVIGTNGAYFPVTLERKTKTIPPGLYKILYSQQQGYYVQKQNYQTDELLDLPISEIKSIMSDITKFWDRAETFKKYSYVHKRGILLYGPPGCGKSCAIQTLIKDLIEIQKGIVFTISNGDDLDRFTEVIPSIIKEIEPNKPIVAIMEDVDGLCSYGPTETKLLNLLDGLKQLDKIVYVATTNYPEQLKERILNRPSRFDRRYKISHPSAEVREFYFKNKLFEDDLKSIDLAKWVSETEGMSISHLRELIASSIILGNPFEESIEALKGLSIIPSSTEDKKSSIGFTKKNI